MFTSGFSKVHASSSLQKEAFQLCHKLVCFVSHPTREKLSWTHVHGLRSRREAALICAPVHQRLFASWYLCLRQVALYFQCCTAARILNHFWIVFQYLIVHRQQWACSAWCFFCWRLCALFIPFSVPRLFPQFSCFCLKHLLKHFSYCMFDCVGEI